MPLILRDYRRIEAAPQHSPSRSGLALWPEGDVSAPQSECPARSRTGRISLYWNDEEFRPTRGQFGLEAAIR